MWSMRFIFAKSCQFSTAFSQRSGKQKENAAKDSKIQLQNEKISSLEKKVRIHLSCDKIELKNQNIEDLKKDINEIFKP